ENRWPEALLENPENDRTFNLAATFKACRPYQRRWHIFINKIEGNGLSTSRKAVNGLYNRLPSKSCAALFFGNDQRRQNQKSRNPLCAFCVVLLLSTPGSSTTICA